MPSTDIKLTLPSSLTAEWLQGAWDFERETYKDASIVLFFGEYSVGIIPIPDGFAKHVPMAQGAVDGIVAEFLRKKLFTTEREDVR